MTKPKFWTYENKLLIILFFAFGFVFFDRQALNFLIPFIVEDLHLNNTQIGLLASGLALTWALSGPIVGLFADKTGKKKQILIIFILIFSTLSLLHGTVTSFAMLLVLRLLMGFAEGPVLPISQSMMAVASSPSRRGFNMGFMQSTAASMLGSVLAPLIIVALATTFDWRKAFYLTIVPGLILVFFIWKHVKAKEDAVEAINQTDSVSIKDVKLMDVVKHRNIWMATLISIFSLTWFLVYITFVPVYLVGTKELSPGSMSLIMSAVGFGGVLWGFAVPAISDKIGRKPAMIFFSFVSALSPLVVLLYNGGSLWLLALLIFLFHTGQGVQPLFMSTIPAESIPVKYIAVSVGLIMGVGELIGGVISPLLAGFAADSFGTSAPLIISISGALIAGILSMFMIETAPVKTKEKIEGDELAKYSV